MRTIEIPRTRGVTAVLGPTNTGKTHLAIERMLGHDTGLMGLPLRLLAREVYDKIVGRIGAEHVALITGEEKIKPERPRFYICTVEAMPREVDVDFLAIDEVQLAADPERGHVFTDRLIHARGRQETLLLGAQTMRETINDLLPGANHISRPRLSKLTYAGQKKLSRLPRRSAVVAFSANDVYAIAELMRRQRGGAAVVLGALSPRTRNAQVALYQSGDVDFLVATDAIGMGLNLDVDHVAFAGIRKFDGHVHRELTPGELAQIAGRAGRHMNDGTFGVTGDVEPLAADLVDRLEQHTFEPVRILQWRNRDLDFSGVERLKDSLREVPAHQRLQRARMSDDTIALENLSLDRELMELARTPESVRLLWDVCQVPDYRKISSASHCELIAQIFRHLRTGGERIPEDWIAHQVAQADRTDGDIDTLATRIAHVRTWTFVSNRAEWLAHPEEWQAKAREIEDKLSDALHERLTQRFVDRRTSVLMRKLNDKDELFAEIADDGAIQVEGHPVGRLMGFRFIPDTTATDIHGKAARHAASQVVAKELGMRARRVASAQADALKLTRKGTVEWRGQEIARLERSEDPLKPVVQLIADEHLSGPDRERVQKRLEEWLQGQVEDKLRPLVAMKKAEDITGLARGIAFRLTEGFGVLKREDIADELRSLDQTARSQLRQYGVRFGAFNVYFPILLKPAAAELSLVLWALRHAEEHGLQLEALPQPPRAGLTSVAAEAGKPEAFYRACGFHLCGPRAVRLDMLERLADLIRPLTAWRADPSKPQMPPKGASGNGGFLIIPEMMSIMGCGAEELGSVLKALGFWVERRKKVRPAAAEAAIATPTEAAAAGAEVAAEPASSEAPAPVEDSSQPAEAVAEAIASEAAEIAAPVEAPSVEEVAPTSEPTPASIEPAAPAEAVEPVSAEATASTPSEAGPSEPGEGEVVAEATAPSPETAAASVAEDEYEEVWRPRRRGAPRERDRERGKGWRRPPQGGKPAQGAAGAPAVAAEGTEPRRDGKDRGRPGGGRDRDRGGSGSDREPRREGRGPREGRDKGGRPHGDRRERGHDRRDDRRRDGDRPRLMATTEKKRGSAPDPNSPFAALGQLKAALERGSGGDGKS